MLTALWRAAGTIPAIVSYCAGLMNPSVMILMAFLLNALVSVLTGTAFGTAATMGVICMTMAKAMGCNEILAGGAILSGVFFGIVVLRFRRVLSGGGADAYKYL